MSKPKQTPIMSVSAVGNSWIVAKSKSHPGHVYYFNTLTGDAVWNLSEAEIQNARKRTQVLANQTGVEPTPHIEPKDNPPTNKIVKPSTKVSGPQQMSQEIQHRHEVNIINLQEPRSSEYSDVVMNNIQPIDYDNFGNPINGVNVISSPVVYNADGWPISQAPIFVTSAIPYLSQGQQMNVACKQLIVPNQAGFNNFNTLNRRFQGPRRKYSPWGQRNFHKYQMRQNDLRQQLHFKRRFGNNTSHAKVSLVEEDKIDGSSSWPCKQNAKTGDMSSKATNVTKEVTTDHEEKKIVDEKNINSHKDELHTDLDLTPLKNLATSNMTSDIFYIVIDLKVLLEEFQFLNTMTKSDKSCHLMVPKNVISELKDYISCSNNVPARLIYHSLMQQVEDGHAFIAEEPSQDFDDSIKNPSLKLCVGLFEQDYHVILITDDSKLLSYKKFIKIHIFSVDEIKSLLNYNPNSDTVSPSKSPKHRPLLVRKKPVDKTVVKNLNFGATGPTKKSEIEDSATVRRTVDAAIQTETVTVISETQKANREVNKDQKDVNVSNNSSTTQISDKPTETVSNAPNKKREIRLRRRASNQVTPIAQSTQKKPFRWRRKRNHPANEATEQITNKDQPASNCEVASVQTDTEHNETELQVNEMSNNETENNAAPDDVIESRESSIIFAYNNTFEDKITIEETSTSGIISNTDSNVDIEMYSNNCEYKENERIDIDENQSKIVMQDDISDKMAETLRTKCEEWVSRYIQIMEDVLAEVLKKEPAFSNIEFRPPWTVHEAAQCIRKYSNDTTVKIITDKLSMVLFRLSDDKGNITRNMTPWQYMEMYSYGVSLLEAVKVFATSSMQDIQLAEESLRKLLMDIKNADHSLIDSQEHSQSIHESSIEIEQTELTSPRKKKSRLDNKTTKSYNLRSKSLNSSFQEEEKSPNDSIEPNGTTEPNVKATFFSKLNLQVTSPINNLNKSSMSSGSTEEKNETTQPKSHNEDKNSKVGSETGSIPSTQVTPKIVRNFSICAEFEERLKYKVNAGYDEFLNSDEDYEYGSEEDYDEHDEFSDPNITQLETSDIDISGGLVTSSPLPVEPHVGDDSNDTFKFMICLFLQEIKNAINEVKILCDKCYTELKTPQLPITERNELRKRAETAQTHIVGLSTSLNSMLEKNPEAPNDSMMSALKKAGINMSQIDKRLLLDYWNTVAEWKKYADVFSSSIKDIIMAFKTLNG